MCTFFGLIVFYVEARRVCRAGEVEVRENWRGADKPWSTRHLYRGTTERHSQQRSSTKRLDRSKETACSGIFFFCVRVSEVDSWEIKLASFSTCACKYLRYNNDSNNNLRLIMVKTNRSTLHTVYNIQQSAMQGSNDTTHRLSHRTAAMIRHTDCHAGQQQQPGLAQRV